MRSIPWWPVAVLTGKWCRGNIWWWTLVRSAFWYIGLIIKTVKKWKIVRLLDEYEFKRNSGKGNYRGREEDKKSIPLYTIGIVAELIGITSETLRLYEKHGLIRPARKNNKRFYSDNDLQWIHCLRDLIHNKKISIEGIKKLLNYAPCWELTGCSKKTRDECSAYTDKTKPYWELNNQNDIQKGIS